MWIQIIAFLCAITLPTTPVAYQTRVFSDDNSPQQGKIWLSWDKPQKLGFLSGYVNGRLKGHRTGCLDYEIGTPYRSSTAVGEKLPEEKCMDLSPKFSRTTEEYEQLVTRYYKNYPDDRNLPIAKLLFELSDNQNMSLDHIHQWFHSPDENE